MNFRSVLLVGSLAATLGGCYSVAAVDPTVPTRGVVLNEHAAVAAINRYRSQNGLGPVVLDARLTRAAVYAARSNATANSLSHDAGGSFQARMAQTGLARGLKAENLGAGTSTFEQTLAMWQGSSSHNTNLLLPEARRIGIARADAPGTAWGRFWAMEVAQ